MASMTTLSRIFGNISINLSKRIDTRLISTTNTTEYLRKRLYPLNPIKYRKNIRVEVPWFPKTPPHQREIIDTTAEDDKTLAAVTNEINAQIEKQETGRLFAVVQVCGKQYKITDTDLIVIHGYWPPTSGDQLKLEKVLLLGSKDFTLVGRPLLSRDLVSIEATVVEKTFSHVKTHFRLKKRKQYRRIHFNRSQHTIMRINSISINKRIDQVEETEGANRIF